MLIILKGVQESNLNTLIQINFQDENLNNEIYYLDILSNDKLARVDGNYELRLSLKNDKIIFLQLGRSVEWPLYISPNESLVLTINEIDVINSIANIQYEGSLSEKNLLLNRIWQELDEEDNFPIYNTGEIDFINKIEELRGKCNALLDQYIFNSNVEELDFNRKTRQLIDLNIQILLRKYPITSTNNFQRKQLDLTAFESCFTEIIEPELIEHYLFRRLVVSDLMHEYYKSQMDIKGKNYAERLYYFLPFYSNYKADSDVQDFLRAYLMLVRLEYGEIDSIPDFIVEIDKIVNPIYRDILMKKINSLQENSKNLASQNFYLKTLGDSILLDSLKGKLLYVDFWATWCAPCIAQQKVLESYIARNPSIKDKVTFVSISLDHDEQQWKEYIQRKSIESNLLHFYGNEKIGLFFGVSILPSYALIDPMFNISILNAPKPGSDSFFELFDSFN